MQAVILAAGNATRFKPYSDVIPKDLMFMGERPIIRHIADRYKKPVIVCRKEFEDQYRHEFRDSRALIIPVSGGSGSLADFLMAFPELPYSEYYLIHYADCLINYEPVKPDVKITLYLTQLFKLPFGVVQSVDGKVLSVAEKPVIGIPAWSGVGVFHRSVFEEVQEGDKDFATDLIPRYVQKGEVKSVMIEGSYWRDMNTYKGIKEVEQNGYY